MNFEPSTRTEFPPLKPVDFHVLLALVERDRHGYGIVKEIEARTDGGMRLVPGNLYPVLRRLVDAGWLEEGVERPAEDLEHRQRRYYSITPLGKRAATVEAVRMRSLVEKRDVRDLIEGWSRG